MSNDCKPADVPVPSMDDSDFKQIMYMLGKKTCKTSIGCTYNDKFYTSAQVDAFKGSASGSVENEIAGACLSTTDGCEELQLLAQSYKKYTELATCIANNSEHTSTVDTSVYNTLNITASHSDIKCTTLDISQISDVKIISVSEMTTNEKNDIANTVKEFLDSIINISQDAKTGIGATPQGQQTITQLKTQINNKIDTIISNSIVDKALNITKSANTITINLDYSTLSGDACKVNQNTIVDLSIKNLFATAIANAVKNTNITKVINNYTATQKSESEGIGGLLGFLPLLIIGAFVIIPVILFFMFGSSILKYILPIVLLASIIMCVIFSIQNNWVAASICGVGALGVGFFFMKHIMDAKKLTKRM